MSSRLAAQDSSRPVVTVSIDGFHRTRAERVAAGTGPGGFYNGSYRYDAILRCMVDPLRAGHAIIPAVRDVTHDQPVIAEPMDVADDGLVIVDGIFLHRPELVQVWDASVWVRVPFAISLPRGNSRFPEEHDPDPEARSNRRYVGGQRLYLAEADPECQATWIFDNTALDEPRLIHW